MKKLIGILFAILTVIQLSAVAFAAPTSALKFSAPSITSVTSKGNAITINWKAVSGADSYIVCYGTSSTLSKAKTVKVGNVTKYTCSDLAYGTSYYLWIKAVKGSVYSSESSRKSVKTEAAPKLSAPFVTSVTAKGNAVTISWKAVSGADSYIVCYGTSSTLAKAKTVKVGNVTKYTCSDLAYGTSYYLWIKAVKGSVYSSESSRKSVKTEAAPKLSAPSVTSVTAKGNAVTIGWKAVSGAASYIVCYGTSSTLSNAKTVKVGNVTKYTCSDLAYGTSYYFWVKAVNGSVYSSESSRKSIKTEVALKPATTSAAGASTSTSNTVSVTTGIYATLKNLGSGKMLNVYGSRSADNTNITVYSKDGTSGQLFKAVLYNGKYYFVPKCAASSAVNVYGSAAKADANVCIWKLTMNPTQLWKVDYNPMLKGFVLRSADNPDYVLTACGSVNSSNVCLKKYSASDKFQIWTSDIFQLGGNTAGSGSGFDLVWPTVSRAITGKYGENGSLRGNGTRYHSGVDIGASLGSNCYAAADGKVIFCKSTDDAKTATGGRGRYIVIYHKNGDFSTIYEHLNTVKVSVGDTVKAGQVIGTTGNSGWQSQGTHYAAHLHFGLIRGKMADMNYDLWYVKNGINHTIDPDPMYNKELRYTYK